MKRLTVCLMLVLGGCQSTIEEPNQTTVLAGDYTAVSDCFYRKVATTPGYKKVDAPSTRTITIEGSTGWRIGRQNRLHSHRGRHHKSASPAWHSWRRQGLGTLPVSPEAV